MAGLPDDDEEGEVAGAGEGEGARRAEADAGTADDDDEEDEEDEMGGWATLRDADVEAAAGASATMIRSSVAALDDEGPLALPLPVPSLTSTTSPFFSSSMIDFGPSLTPLTEVRRVCRMGLNLTATLADF